MKLMQKRRRAVILPMFAILLPILLIVCFMVINLAQMQLTRTELKIATDAAARAGGRAWSKHHDVAVARQFASTAAELNDVAGNASAQ